jgi:hypothetical protein
MFFCVYLNFSRPIHPPFTKEKKGWASGYCTYVTDLKRNSWNCSHEYEYALKMQTALSKRQHFIEDNTHTHLYGSHKILRPLKKSADILQEYRSHLKITEVGRVT